MTPLALVHRRDIAAADDPAPQALSTPERPVRPARNTQL
jgi:hypothetical protein